jgi:uncharacterized protein YjbI with pentapeptide repeats
MRHTGPTPFGDLPFRELLTETDQRPERGTHYEGVHFTGMKADHLRADGTGFSRCAFSDVSLGWPWMRRHTLDNAWLRDVQMAAPKFDEAEWTDVEFSDSRILLGGLKDATLRRVTFHHCELDYVILRGARLEQVRFVNCLLRSVDFSGSVLTDVAFPGSTLDRVRFRGVRADELDLRGIDALGISGELSKLRGAVVAPGQLLEIAETLAWECGIEVRD